MKTRTETGQRILNFVALKNKAGTCPSIRDIRRALGKTSYGSTYKQIQLLKKAKKLVSDRGNTPSLRIGPKSSEPLRVQQVYIIGDKTSWPLKTGKGAKRVVWLDPGIFALDNEKEYIVLEAGALWEPSIKIEPGDQLIVELSKDGNAQFVFHNQKTLDVGHLTFSSASSGRLLNRDSTRNLATIQPKDILGRLVGRIQHSNF